MHIKHPSSFFVPTKSELEKLKIGGLVKVSIGDERFWAKITEIDGEKIKALVDNVLINTDKHGLELGDEITFNKTNVHAIY